MSTVEAKVIRAFSDADDLSRAYAPGDRFKGGAERVESLAARGFVAIEKPERAVKSKPKE